MTIRREMTEWRATSARSESRVTCEPRPCQSHLARQSCVSRTAILQAVPVGERDAPVIRYELSLFHNHAARDAGPTRRILCRRVRQMLIVQLMDDEGAPIRIEQGVEPLRQGHPTRDRIQRPIPVVVHGEVLEIAEMIGMVP